MTPYITFANFEGTAICGEVSLTAGTVLTADKGLILAPDGRVLCTVSSENAHRHFAPNGDGCGMLRGALTAEIGILLASRPEGWEALERDPVAAKYRREGEEDFAWGEGFYAAPVLDLEHIAGIVSAGEESE